MASFLKVLFNNLLAGPSTDPFPLGETFTPDRVRGRCVVDPDLCVGCGICKHVCAAGAIDITPKEDKSGYTITIWRNSCCLCGSCRHYCPTGAMSINNDWHNSHTEDEKYECLEQHTIDYEPCRQCGTLFRPLPLKVAEKIYAHNKDVDPDAIRHLCPGCRQIEDAREREGVLVKPEPEAIEETSTGQGVEVNTSESVPIEKIMAEYLNEK